ncbi:MAG: hypothetical protein M1829_001886 [Trizodia sp. TS-e1964]|nr:MAG: hypothetical protein M1829_001886 [Trizodia sp. TS-e1964]
MNAPAARSSLLLTFDAFGTLFAPREPIARQYLDVAARFGIGGVNEMLFAREFQRVLKEQSRIHPNYGKKQGLKPEEWWANIIHTSFRPFLPEHTKLPQPLIPTLLTHFSSAAGYRLYPDVLPLFETLRHARQNPNPTWPWEQTIIGVVTNSDGRVPQILSSLGLRVGGKDADVSFVAGSYDIGFEKPHPEIFAVAKEMADIRAGRWEFEHVGDDWDKDVLGARAAGWRGILLDRERANINAERRRVLSDLRDLIVSWRPSTRQSLAS